MKKDIIHFFGTTGSKDVFFNKIRLSGGLYLDIDDTKLILDPGPGTFYQYISHYKNEIDGIVLSHVHIDHSNDLNLLVELMTDGGENKKGTVLLPNQALEDRVLQPYVANFPEELEVIKPKAQYQIKNIEITTSIEHRHGVENYGFKIKTKNHVIGLVTDTGYFSELIDSYQKCEILIINVPYYRQNKPKPKHLEIANVEELIQNIKPKKVILTHFNQNMIENYPVKIAEDLSRKYEIEVIAAEDGMILEL